MKLVVLGLTLPAFFTNHVTDLDWSQNPNLSYFSTFVHAIFFLSAIFAHLSSLAECHFFQKAFCDHAIQSNRVLSHTPLTFSWFALFRIFITVGYYHQYLLGFLPCFCLHLTECYIWKMQAVTEHGHCLFTCGFLFIT